MIKQKTAFLLTFFSLTAALVLYSPAPADAQGVMVGDAVVITAEVVAIDLADRTIALRGPKGNVVALKVGPEARNLDQVKIGDKLRVKYFESVALYLGKHGQKPGASADAVAGRSAKGDKPAGVIAETVDVSATVKEIDRESRTVTLALVDGSTTTTKVGKDVEAFDTLKVGDSVHASYTKALAISVETP